MTLTRNELSMSGDERAALGAIYSLRHHETGETTTIHLTGPRLDCARRVAAMIDASCEDWRVVCVSTPESIYTDLQGSRNLQRDAKFDPRTGREINRAVEFDPIMGERFLFGRIGRPDLLPHISNDWWIKHKTGHLR